jgi:hypothetical protein
MNKDKLIDTRNQILYDSIRTHYKVNLKKSDSKSWGSNLDKNTVVISHYNTNYPISSFTHELLHIDTQLNGYKRVRLALSLDPTTHSHLGRLIQCIDNEFQHHKMFDKFIQLGFPPEEFYNDLDSDVVPYLENQLKTLNKSFLALSVDYLTLIAPGGVIKAAKIEELQQLFYNYNEGIFREKFQVIDKIISEWINDSSYDAEKYIIKFFQNLDAGKTWITYDGDLNEISINNFPSTGFFTNQSFTIQEIQEAFGGN